MSVEAGLPAIASWSTVVVAGGFQAICPKPSDFIKVKMEIEEEGIEYVKARNRLLELSVNFFEKTSFPGHYRSS